MTNPIATAEFLRCLRPGGPWQITAINSEGTGIETRTFGAEELDALIEWADRRNDRGWNIYYTICPVRTDDKKPRRADVVALTHLWVDVDPRDANPDDPENVRSAHFDREQDRLLRLLDTERREDVPRPSLLVYSGSGMQALWKLAEPISLDGTEECADDAARRNVALAKLLGGDSTHNVDRLFRLPGFFNHPDQRKAAKGRLSRRAELMWAEDSVYPASEFVEAAPETPQGVAQVDIDTNDVTRLNGPDDLDQWSVSPRIKAVIVQGHDPVEADRYPSRSEAVFAVCCELLRCKVPQETIYAVLTDPDFGISASVLEKGDRQALRAISKARLAVATAFRTNKDGVPFNDQHNIEVAIAKLGVSVEYDEFSNRKMIGGLDGFGPHLDDAALNRMRMLTGKRFGFLPSKDLFHDVVSDTTMDNRRHPVREYLDGLAWDGTERLSTWLVRYAGATDSEYIRAVARLLLIAAVRRVRRPGVKFDQMVVLEGPQGTGKSTLLKTLAVKDDWFCDDLPLNADSKRYMEILSGKWIVEAGELRGVKRDVDNLKAFLSRQYDRARLAYGREATEHARQCVIIGSTNSEQYLRDTTGNRRFWPVMTGKIDLAAFKADRDQLWAEAAVAEAASESITLDSRLWSAAAEQQADREMGDGWEDLLNEHLDDASGKIKVNDVWLLLGIAPRDRGQDAMARLGQVMRRLGWDRARARFGGKLAYCYRLGCDRTLKAVKVSESSNLWEVRDA